MLQITSIKVYPRRESGAGSFLANVIITFEHCLRIKCSLMQSTEGEGQWLSWPSRSYEKNGEKKWVKEVEVSRMLDESLRDKVINEYYKTTNMPPVDPTVNNQPINSTTNESANKDENVEIPF